jgi:hypothetical protein
MFLFQVILYWKMPGSNGKWWYTFMSIYGGVIISYIIIKSALITLHNGGIYWRDTFYSLVELAEINEVSVVRSKKSKISTTIFYAKYS